MHPILYLVFCCLLSSTLFTAIVAINSSDYKLTIIHANDLLSAFAGVNSDDSLCDLNNDLKHCVGGAPKIVAKIRELRSKEFVLFVNAGNNLGGFWYKQFGSKVVTDFLREIQFDVITLGLSDYELYNVRQDSNEYLKESSDNVTQFINDVSFFSRIVSCNVEVDTKYISNFYSNVRKSTKINSRVGVIGFVKPPNHPNIGSFKREPNYDPEFDFVRIRDPIKCLQEESERLRKEGIAIILAVGTGDQDFFKEIASNVPNVDLVIGSYASSKNLSLLKQRSNMTYPDLVVESSSGNVIVATADVFGKSIGKITVLFDKRGNIKSSEGTLIALEDQTDLDMRTSKLVDNYQRSLLLGMTYVYLNGTDCATQECNLGNVITDALVFYRVNYINDTFIKSLIKSKGNEVMGQRIDEKRDVIALISSEMIENSIGDTNRSEYFITKISLNKVFNKGKAKIQMLILDGKTIRLLLEQYVWPLNVLQVSGIKVVYDLSKPINETIIEISVKCTLCLTQQYSQLNETTFYEVLMPQTIPIEPNEHVLSVAHDLSAFDILELFIRETSPINTTLQDRITVIPPKGANDAFGTKSEFVMALVSALILFMSSQVL